MYLIQCIKEVRSYFSSWIWMKQKILRIYISGTGKSWNFQWDSRPQFGVWLVCMCSIPMRPVETIYYIPSNSGNLNENKQLYKPAKQSPYLNKPSYPLHDDPGWNPSSPVRGCTRRTKDNHRTVKLLVVQVQVLLHPQISSCSLSRERMPAMAAQKKKKRRVWDSRGFQMTYASKGGVLSPLQPYGRGLPLS